MKNIKLLSRPVERSSHNYAFIDRAFYNQVDNTLPVLEVVTPNIQAQAHLYPYLLILGELDDESWIMLNQRIESQITAREPLLCSTFFSSSLQPKALCHALAENLIRKYDDGHYILRYYDPRVLGQLLWMFSDSEWLRFYQETKTSSWSFCLNGSWHSFDIEPLCMSDSSSTKDNEKDDLLRIGNINKALSSLPKEIEIGNYILLSKKINNYIKTSEEKYGFVSADDKVSFSIHNVLIGEGFDDTPFMVKAMNSELYRKYGYVSFMKYLSTNDWEIIKYQLTHSYNMEVV